MILFLGAAASALACCAGALAGIYRLDLQPEDAATLMLLVAPPLGLVIGFLLTRWRKELRLGRLAFGTLVGAGLGVLTRYAHFPSEGIASALYRSLLLVPFLVMVAAGVGGAVAYVFWGGGKFDAQFGFETYVGMRYLRSLRGSVLSVVSVIALVGVTLGVGLMIAALALLSGFEGDLIDKLIGADAHLTVSKYPGYMFEPSEVPGVVEAAKQLGARVASPYISAEVMVASDSNRTEAKLTGIDPVTGPKVFALFDHIIKGNPSKLERQGKGTALLPPPTEVPELKRIELPMKNDSASSEPSETLHIFPPKRPAFATHLSLPGVVMGAEMARSLHVEVDDTVTVVSPLVDELTPQGPAPKSKTFRVAALFDVRMYSVDAHYIYVLADEAQKFMEMGKAVSGVAFVFDDPNSTERLAAPLLKALGGYPFQSLSWQERQKSLFMSLKLEKAVAFIVLIFIVLVASFSIVNTLTMSVIEKAREIAILKTMGAKDVSISRVFVLQGAAIGLVGTVIGVIVGCSLSLALSKLSLAVDADVYYLDHLPIRLHVVDIAQVCLLTLVLTALSAVFPALGAARLSPVEGLRYE